MAGVEVLKGSSQIGYGPNTTGGVINFLSTPIPEDQQFYCAPPTAATATVSSTAIMGYDRDRFRQLRLSRRALSTAPPTDSAKSLPARIPGGGDTGFGLIEPWSSFRGNRIR